MCWDLMYGIHTMNHILLWILFTCSLFQILKFISFLLVVAFCLYWGETHTHTHTRVKLHWDTKCHNPKNPLQVNCWQREGLRCWLPVHPARQRPPSFRFSWASSVSRVLCQWNEVFSAAGLPGLQPPSSARRPRRGRFPASLPRGAAGARGPSHPPAPLAKGLAVTWLAAPIHKAELIVTESSVAWALKLQSTIASTPFWGIVSKETPSSIYFSLPCSGFRDKTSPWLLLQLDWFQMPVQTATVTVPTRLLAFFFLFSRGLFT